MFTVIMPILIIFQQDINLVVFFDSAGNPENWRIKYMNNEINGQPVLKASLSKQRGHMVFYSKW